MLVVFAALAALTGCDKPKPAATPKPAVAAGTGSITGVVTFAGGPAEPRLLKTETCCEKPTPTYDESLVVDADGGMRNVVVYLENGPNVPTTPPPVVLDQVGCRYVPHVVAVRVGQTLRVTSSDPTLHNVHALSKENKAFNQHMTAPGQSKDVTFTVPEQFEVRCDVHHWMRAQVAVFDHPFFAVTGEGGRFELKDVPPGTYTLVARHERYLERRATVTVGDGPAPAVTIKYEK